MTRKVHQISRRRIPFALFAGFVLSSSIAGIAGAYAGSTALTTGGVDQRIVIPTTSVDSNHDGIDDRLEQALNSSNFNALPNAVVRGGSGMAELKGFGSSAATVVDLIVCLNHAPTAADVAVFQKAGFKVEATYSHVIYAVHIVGTATNGVQTLRNLIASNPKLGITLIQGNNVAHLNLYKSTSQIGARQSWPAFENYNNGLPLTGDPNRSICIMDTGIDGTHPDLNGGTASTPGTKISNWVDTDDTSATSPIDTDGHGSHVAGIAAGTGYSGGLQSGIGTIPVTIPEQFDGNIPASATTAGEVTNPPFGNFNAAIPVDTSGYSTATSMTISAQWYQSYALGGTNTVSFFDPTGAGAGAVSGSALDSNSVFAVTTPVAAGTVGDYTFDFQTSEPLTEIDPNFPLSPGASTNTSPFLVHAQAPFTAVNGGAGDGFNLVTGVAPTSSLVGVGIGVDPVIQGLTDAATLAGYDYISAEAQRYNIGVVNMSFGEDATDTVEDTIVDNLVNQGIVCCVAAGNSRGETTTTTTTGGTTTATTTPLPQYIGSPGTASNAITVAAIGNANEITDYSSQGVTGQSKPDVAAPGGVNLSLSSVTGAYNTSPTGFTLARQEPILSVQTNTDADVTGFYYTDVTTTTGTTTGTGTGGTTTTTLTQVPGNLYQPNPYPNSYTEDEGTSMAAPHVTGSVALIEQAMDIPGALGGAAMSAGDEAKFIKALLEMTASQTVQLPDAAPNITPTSGARDFNSGYGKINTDAALEAVLQSALPGDTVTDTVGFGSAATAPQCFARNVALEAKVPYTFKLTGPAAADYEIYLYSTSYASDSVNPISNGATGDPVLLAESNTAGTSSQALSYTPTTNETVIMVVKRVPDTIAVTTVAAASGATDGTTTTLSGTGTGADESLTQVTTANLLTTTTVVAPTGTGPFTVAITGGGTTPVTQNIPVTTTVTDASTGAAVSDALVNISDQTTSQQYNAGATSSSGVVTFSAPGSAKINVTATAQGYFTGATTATVPATPASGSTASPTPLSVAVSLTPTHTFGTGLQLISVPYGYTAALNEITLPKIQIAAVWVPSQTGYVTTPTAPADTFHLGSAYWVRLKTPVSLLNPGAVAPTGYDSIPISFGWNMIGDPYSNTISLANVTVVDNAGKSHSFANAVSTGLVGVLYSYDNSNNVYATVPTTGSVQPFIGYWIYATGAKAIVIPSS